MPTIQIRDVPDDAYETIRRRARDDGRSLQSYLRDRLIEMAARPTKVEALAAIEAMLATSDSPGPTSASVLADLEAERR